MDKPCRWAWCADSNLPAIDLGPVLPRAFARLACAGWSWSGRILLDGRLDDAKFGTLDPVNGPTQALGALLRQNHEPRVSNKVNLCCASHPRVSEAGQVPVDRPVWVEMGDRQ